MTKLKWNVYEQEPSNGGKTEQYQILTNKQRREMSKKRMCEMMKESAFETICREPKWKAKVMTVNEKFGRNEKIAKT